MQIVKATDNMDKIDLQYLLKRKKITQVKLANTFSVTCGAITQALDNHPMLSNLRKKIINLINNN